MILFLNLERQVLPDLSKHKAFSALFAISVKVIVVLLIVMIPNRTRSLLAIGTLCKVPLLWGVCLYYNLSLQGASEGGAPALFPIIFFQTTSPSLWTHVVVEPFAIRLKFILVDILWAPTHLLLTHDHILELTKPKNWNQTKQFQTYVNVFNLWASNDNYYLSIICFNSLAPSLFLSFKTLDPKILLDKF